MKSRNVLLGTLGATLIAATVLFTSKTNENGHYQPRNLKASTNAQGIKGAHQYYDMIMRNNLTGDFDGEAYSRAQAEAMALSQSGNRAEMQFINHGPSNIGGRTRGILIDKDNVNIVYAGAVSGGLFKSTNRGNSWKEVKGYQANFAISSICQTANGNIYVSTGHLEDRFRGENDSGMNGDGVYMSADDGETFTLISGTETNQWINEVVAMGNKVLIGGEDGLKVYDPSDNSLDHLFSVTSNCNALSISPDEQVIVADLGVHRTYVSVNGGSTFEDVSGSESNGLIPFQGVGRMEYAISHEKVDGNYYIYASQCTGNGAFKGVFYTTNNGDSWARIAPANDGTPGSFEPFGDNSQGNYNQTIIVVKGNPEAIIFGGIEVYAKSLNQNWELRSNGFVPKINPIYVHSDQHEMRYDSEGRLWIGNDGGMCYSDDDGQTFRDANRGYSVTQYYGISASAHGDVMGGTQDNGTSVNYHDNHTYQDHDEFSGGDGFTCAMSFMNRDVAFSTLYFGLIFRSGDRGFNVSPYTAANIENCVPGSFQGDGCGTFYTSIELYENPNDTKSTDSIIFRPTENLSAGDTINIPSATSQQFIQHVLTQNVTFDDSVFADPALTILDTIVSDTAAGITLNLYNTSYTYVGGSAPLSVGDTILVDGVQIIVYTLTTQDHYFATNAANASQIFDLGNTDFAVNVSWDTIVVQDVYQSWLALGLGAGEGVWLTRNGLRFSATHDGFLKGGGGISGSVTDLEFSKDGAHLYVGTSTGRFYRLSGIDTIYSPNPILGNFNGNVEDSLLNFDHPNTQATFELINSFGAPVLGINVDKTDPDIVVVALGGFGGAAKVQRSTDATTAGNFTAIDGNLPDMPCLSVVMDRENPNDILVGTEFGLYRTENGGGDWSYVDAPFGRVPIFDLMQNWRTWDEGCFSNGQMYVGTHGRGIWTTNEFLSAPEAQDNIEMPVSISNITLYPNPVITDATISFDVREAGKGSVKVFNLSGQLVVNMNDISLNAGNNLITLGLDELSTGTYIVKLTTDSESRTTKFIKH